MIKYSFMASDKLCHAVPFGLLVWSTGICASPLVKNTDSIAKDKANSFFLTDDHLNALVPTDGDALQPKDEVEGKKWLEGLRTAPDVYAIGDCAQIVGRTLPATAQVASQKAKHIALVLNGQMGEDMEAGERVFKHKDMGSMASLGSGSAIVDSPGAKAQGRVSKHKPKLASLTVFSRLLGLFGDQLTPT